MRSNRVDGPLVAALVALGALVFLFWAGRAPSASAQTREPYRVRPGAVADVRAPHTASVRGGYAGAGYTRARYASTRAAPGRRAATHSTHRPVYSRVNVNVVVRPVYPEYYGSPAYPAVGPVYPAAGGWYASYPYQYPYVTYANGYYPYVYYPYYLDLTAEGYRDGLHRGQDDAEDGRYYDPYRRGFKNPESVTYSNGFLNGYAVGYSR